MESDVRSTPYANDPRSRGDVKSTIDMRPVLHGLLARLTVAFASGPAAGQETGQDKTGKPNEIFGRATPTTPGCAVAVSPNREHVLDRAYGSADLERNVPLALGTVFDAGALTKQFVAAVLLLDGALPP